MPSAVPDSRDKEVQLVPSNSLQSGQESNGKFQCPAITVIVSLRIWCNEDEAPQCVWRPERRGKSAEREHI